MWIPKLPKCPHGLRDIVDKYLPEDEVENFADWAFGEDYLELHEIINFANKWNELHGDLYMLDMSGTVVYDLKIMCDLWKEHGQQSV